MINYLLSHPEVVSRTNQGHIQSRQIIELLRQYKNGPKYDEISTRNASSYETRYSLKSTRDCISNNKGFSLFDSQYVIIGYVTRVNEYDFAVGDVILYGWTNDTDRIEEPHCVVDENSIFVHTGESHRKIENNGSESRGLHPETSTNPKMMKKALKKFIEDSREENEGIVNSRCIRSNHDSETNTYKGIIIYKDKYTEGVELTRKNNKFTNIIKSLQKKIQHKDYSKSLSWKTKGWNSEIF